LDQLLAPEVSGPTARRKVIDVLLGFWDKSAAIAPRLHQAALDLYQNAYTTADYLWLHYGLGLVYYPIFRQVVGIIGQLGRLQPSITRQQIKARVIAEWGHRGGIDRSIERICHSLTEWGLFSPTTEKTAYRPEIHVLQTDNPDLELWLLACALFAHPSKAILEADLLRLPELYPFAIQVSHRSLAKSLWFTLTREGGLEMVRLNQVSIKPQYSDAPTITYKS
jgi:hypothetical protein